VSEVGDRWEAAGGSWEPLGTLLARVERDMGIPSAQAAAVLKPALTSGYLIRAEVVDWRHVPVGRYGPNRNDWVWWDGPEPGANRPTDEGWNNVDWTAGALAGCSIRILWAHVVNALADVPRSRAATWAVVRTNAEETRLVTWLTERMRAAPDSPRPKREMREAAVAAGHVVGDRPFNRAWTVAAKLSEAPAWSAAGARRKSTQSNRNAN
jgi:hypothetical protein